MSDAENYELSNDLIKEIEHWLAKFPKDKRQSAVLQALRIVQDKEGWLSTPMMDAVAEYIGMPKINVYEVATFYSMYHLKPAGKHRIYVCESVSCFLCGSQDIMEHLKRKLDVKVGETTKDGKFSLHAAECLAACRNAPAIQINRDYYENLTTDKVDALLENLE